MNQRFTKFYQSIATLCLVKCFITGEGMAFYGISIRKTLKRDTYQAALGEGSLFLSHACDWIMLLPVSCASKKEKRNQWMVWQETVARLFIY
jgi:hypothetical protein